MVIHIKGLSTFSRCFGEDSQQVELPAGATLQDLMYVIDTKWSGILSPQFWDADKKKFRGVVVVAIDNNAIREPTTVLQNNQEVLLVKILAGG
jgi:hypothetical protein